MDSGQDQQTLATYLIAACEVSRKTREAPLVVAMATEDAGEEVNQDAVNHLLNCEDTSGHIPLRRCINPNPQDRRNMKMSLHTYISWRTATDRSRLVRLCEPWADRGQRKSEWCCWWWKGSRRQWRYSCHRLLGVSRRVRSPLWKRRPRPPWPVVAVHSSMGHRERGRGRRESGRRGGEVERSRGDESPSRWQVECKPNLL
jgi:hypothetical protein